ncbi:hypothetical protein ACTXPP_06220 [Candidatus Corynebacterium faecigallinarum]|jgi:hypothetical protein|uniref:hypothetical protein n=1 Tax=Candidatus Corynebacterium faecigallinarum TaxID=2838528 RepID=UPI003FD1212B
MSYHHDLAYELRRRGCGEDKVVEVLHTVDDAVSSTGGTAEQELGSPEDYAAQFDGPHKRTPGQKALNVFGLLGVICVAIYAVWPQWFGITTPVLEQFAGMIALLILVVIGVIVGAVIDHRLPQTYKQQQVESTSQSPTV